MSKSRQIQQEVDKKLSLVEEGCSTFNQLLRKIQTAATQTQKERFESDLKKELKKLQRIRDSLRSLESQDSRNKSRIVEAKRKIEELMELHKQAERESKIRTYSKDGLLTPPKVDQLEEEKQEMREMIRATQNSFQDKINVKETELDRTRNNRLKQEEINKHLRALNYHFEKLEYALRSIENDSASFDLIWMVREKLEEYLKNDEDSSLEAEIEQVYKEMNLPNKNLNNFPALNEEETESQKKIAGKKTEGKQGLATVVGKVENRTVEKGWNSKEALIKISGKIEKLTEDLSEDEKDEVDVI
jgi:CCR4-NOT transcription complex subunit 3